MNDDLCNWIYSKVTPDSCAEVIQDSRKGIYIHTHKRERYTHTHKWEDRSLLTSIFSKTRGKIRDKDETRPTNYLPLLTGTTPRKINRRYWHRRFRSRRLRGSDDETSHPSRRIPTLKPPSSLTPSTPSLPLRRGRGRLELGQQKYSCSEGWLGPLLKRSNVCYCWSGG